MEEEEEDVVSAEQAAEVFKLLRAKVGTSWVNVSCGGSNQWTITSGRKLKSAGSGSVYLDCAESLTDGQSCACIASEADAEAFHAITKADFNKKSSEVSGNSLTQTLANKGPMYIFPNNAHETCVARSSGKTVVKNSGGSGAHNESTHAGKCNEWCWGSGGDCP